MCPGRLARGASHQAAGAGPPVGSRTIQLRVPGSAQALPPIALWDEVHARAEGRPGGRAPCPVQITQADTWLRPQCFVCAPSQVTPQAEVGGTEAVTGTCSCPSRSAGAGPRVRGWRPGWSTRPATASRASMSLWQAGGAK